MNKKEIRDLSAFFVACHWARPSSEKAIEWAITHLKKCEELGYTTKPAKDGTKTRASIDYYKKLDNFQKEVFDHFWKNFGKYGDRNRGAMTLIKMWESIQPEIEWLHAGAAGETALRKTRDTTAPYAEKWLKNFSWRDHPNPTLAKAEQTKNKEQEELRELNLNLMAFKQQLKYDQSDTLKNVIKETEAKIKALQEKLK